MYLRTIQRRNGDGSVVRYVQLAHNERHPVSGNAVAKVIHSFGREDQLDRDALSRLVASISRYLGPSAQLQLPAAAGDGGDDTDGELAFVSSRQLGGTWVLDGLWRRLGIDERIRRLLRGRRCDPTAVERVIFALVASPPMAAAAPVQSTGQSPTPHRPRSPAPTPADAGTGQSPRSDVLRPLRSTAGMASLGAAFGVDGVQRGARTARRPAQRRGTRPRSAPRKSASSGASQTTWQRTGPTGAGPDGRGGDPRARHGHADRMPIVGHALLTAAPLRRRPDRAELRPRHPEIAHRIVG